MACQPKRSRASVAACPPRRRRSSASVAAWLSAVASACSSSGATSQPLSPSRTISAGPCALQAITGRPQAIASIRASPNASATEGNTSKSPAFSASGSCSWGRQPARKTLRASSVRIVSSGCSPLPLPRMAADEHKRQVSPDLGLGALVCLDQQGQPLDGREAAQVEEHRFRAERGELVGPVGDAAGRPLLVPALRVVDEPAPPERQPGLTGERPRLEAFQLDAARKPVQPR